MARYTGTKSRIARKFGEGIFGADKVLSKKNYPPGQHGNSSKRTTSEYGVQPVSYTHLDVYKRQLFVLLARVLLSVKVAKKLIS